MYAYLKGILIHFTPSYAIIEAQGIGYQILIPSNVVNQLPQIGNSIKLYTSFVVREFSQALYGFVTEHEKEAFEILLNVTGIGPKLALSLIGSLTMDCLHAAVLEADLPTLCRVPGVGKKTAERLVVELKDKLPTLSATKLSVHASLDQHQKNVQDAVLALVNLGYHQSSAQKAVKQSLKDAGENCDLPTLILASLRNI